MNFQSSRTRRVLSISLGGLIGLMLIACNSSGGNQSGASKDPVSKEAREVACKAASGNNPCGKINKKLAANGWNEAKLPLWTRDGGAKAIVSQSTYSCDANFKMEKDEDFYVLNAIGDTRQKYTSGPKRGKDMPTGSDVRASTLPDAWKVRNLSKSKFLELVANGLAELKRGEPTALSKRLSAICEKRAKKRPS